MSIHFSETQRFKRLWSWLILLIAFLCIRNGFIHGCLDYESLQPEMGIIIFMIFVMTLAFCLILFMRLETRIDETGVYYKYVPLHRSEIKIDWKNIKEAHVRKYNPVLEYGGWGIKLGVFGKGRAYNVSGNMGLQLVLNNGKHLLLGTRKPDEMKEVLNKLADAGIINKPTNQDRF